MWQRLIKVWLWFVVWSHGGTEARRFSRSHAERGNESKYHLPLIMALAVGVFGSSVVQAKFEFTSAVGGGTIDLHLISGNLSQITYEFTAQFRACEGADCGTGNFANYRLALSSDGVYDESRVNVSGEVKGLGGGAAHESGLKLDEVMDFSGQQPEVLSLQSSEPASPSHASITPKGGWTHGKGNGFDHGEGVKADYVTARYNIKLNVDQLKAIALTNDPYLRFYVNGEETSKTTRNNFYDNELVKIKLNFPAQYQVSGLKDMSVVANADPVTDGYYLSQEDFCIYVSRTPLEYSVSVYGIAWSTFDLKSGSNIIHYDVQLGEKKGSSITWDSWTSSPILGLIKENGHAEETCNAYTENNAALRIRIPEGEGGDGIYKDTVTIQIEAT